MNHLLILTSDADDYRELLREYDLADLEIVFCSNEDDAREAIRSCNIVLGEPSMVAKVFHEGRRLEWVQSTFAGVDALFSKALRRDYVLTGVKDVFGPLMCEYVFGYILALERRLLDAKENQNTKTWVNLPYRSLQGLTLGICGLGSIGKHLAQTARHFGMRVNAYKRTPEESPFVDRVYTGASFGKFLGFLDYLVLVLPRTPETTGLMNLQTLKQMKSTAVLINVGRGNAVVEGDLAIALRNRMIRAAVLDVFEEEPLPDDSPLWDLPNAFITPHVAAQSFPKDILQIFQKNYQRFLAKKPLLYVVDFERGY